MQERLTADEVHALIGGACERLNYPKETGRRDWWIFQQVMGDGPETLKALNAFLKDVTMCPPEVIAWCKEYLAPKALPLAAE
jgi:hypothetical protein